MNGFDDAPPPGFENIRVPPHSNSSEQAVLGGVIIAPDKIEDVMEILEPRDFYHQLHRAMFEAMVELQRADEKVDPVILSEKLAEKGLEPNLGYLLEMFNNTPSAANILAYSQLVKNRAIQRRLIQAGNEIASIGFEADRDLDDALDKSQKLVSEIVNQTDEGVQESKSVLKTLVSEWDFRSKNQDKVFGLETGLKDLDSRLNGIKNTDLVIIAARPSMGKTAFVMNVAEQVAVKSPDPLPVHVFSLEMSSEQLLERSTASIGHLDLEKLKRGTAFDDPDDAARVSSAVTRLMKAPILIDDTPGLSINDLRSRARKVKRQHGTGMIIVDYLQLMSGTGDNREQEISSISRGLKNLAKELDIPVLALSQLNRSLENRSDKRPQLSDLRESGAIEQDADIIMFLYRHEYYFPDSEQDRGICEIITRKFRNGEIGTDRVAAVLRQSRFDNLARNYEPRSSGSGGGGSRFEY